MTMPVQLPPGQPVPAAGNITKRAVSCCGYTSHQGVPADWQCPACGAMHEAPKAEG